MLALMHASTEGGYLTINGRAATAKDLARIIGQDPRTVARLIDELEKNGVFSRDARGAIYSRRMVRDAATLQRDIENGRKGGNPRLTDAMNPSSEVDLSHSSENLQQSSEDMQQNCSSEFNDINGLIGKGVNPPLKAELEVIKKEHRPAAYAVQPPLPNHLQAPSAPPEGATPLTPAARLFADGLPILTTLTSKPPSAARALIGKLRKVAGDDCEIVLNAILAAADARPADPVPWLLAACRARSPGKAPAPPVDNDGDLCGIAGWIETLPDVKDDPDPAAPELRRWTINGYYIDWWAEEVAEAAKLPADWRGRLDALADWLRADLDPEAIRRAIERVAARPGYAPPRSLKFFDGAVRDVAGGRRAA